MSIMKIQAIFERGIVRNFLIDGDITAIEFVKKMARIGNLRTLREPRDVPPGELVAELLDQHNTPVGEAVVKAAIAAGLRARGVAAQT